jgi:hypothetical protein
MTMPFAPPWRSYKKGDLLYGLCGDRGVLANKFGIGPSDVYTIDQYGLVANEKAPWNNTTPLKYDPGFINSLAVHDKYSAILDGTELRNSASQELFDARAKRKCKGGINYIVSNTVHHIHFCLDGLNMEQVPSKSYDGSKGGASDSPNGKAPDDEADSWINKSRSITGAELRWIYRNKHRSDVSSKIQFWFNGKESYPPWGPGDVPMKWRKAWAAYIPSSWH